MTFSVLVNSFSGSFHVFNFLIHIFVERKLAMLYKVERRGRRHGLADRSCLKKSPRCYGSVVSPNHSISLNIDDLVILDYSDARGRDVVNLHQLAKAESRRRLAWFRG